VKVREIVSHKGSPNPRPRRASISRLLITSRAPVLCQVVLIIMKFTAADPLVKVIQLRLSANLLERIQREPESVSVVFDEQGGEWEQALGL
jgi:hypothetical protein